MTSTEKPEGFETKQMPGYVPSEPYTRDEIAQGDKPGISNTPGAETWTGNGEEETEFGASTGGGETAKSGGTKRTSSTKSTTTGDKS